jgi:hypothetical protein
LSELEQIRKALADPKPPTQAEFGKLLGAGGQSTYQRWEKEPTSPSGMEALAKAKAIYKKRMKKDWVSPESLGVQIRREELDALRDDLEDACEMIRFLLSLVPEGSRPVALPKKFRTRPIP